MQDNILALADGRSLGYSDYGATEACRYFFSTGRQVAGFFGLIPNCEPHFIPGAGHLLLDGKKPERK